MWLHGLSAAALTVQPTIWPHVLSLVACNHAVLSCGMHPRSSVLGPNLTRLPAAGRGTVVLTFDDGPHPEVTPRVLDVLDEHGATATFFVIGERAALHGPLVREILRRGHAIENHTHRHPLGFAAFGPWKLRREIAAAQAAIADACGRRPTFFRAPMGLRSPLLDPVLAVEGLSLVSWTRRGYDTVSRRPGRILARLTRGLTDGDILLLHDTAARTCADGTPVVLKVLPRLLAMIASAGLTPGVLAEGFAPPTVGGGGSGTGSAGVAGPASRTSA